MYAILFLRMTSIEQFFQTVTAFKAHDALNNLL